MPLKSLENKSDNLKEYLKGLKNAVVAYSSGVDSTFLLKTAYEVLGDNIIALTAKSPLIPQREINEAEEFCKKEGIKHIVVEFDISGAEHFKKNPVNRCYLCKKEIFTRFIQIAAENGAGQVIEGSNIDDTKDYRPGMQAIRELNIKSPLIEAELTKDEIRILSKKMGLKTFDKPSFACLASRIPYGDEITAEKLKTIELAEEFLLNSGFKQFRVRVHGDIARIEILPFEFEKLLKIRNDVVTKFKEYGFKYVSMDLAGYRTGSMNESILH